MPVEDRLDSWKQIASYLQRSIRTVQRWEAEAGLPVHRNQRRKVGAVWALREEVDAWIVGRDPSAGGAGGGVDGPPRPTGEAPGGGDGSARPSGCGDRSRRSTGSAIEEGEAHDSSESTGTGAAPDAVARRAHLRGRRAWSLRTPSGLQRAIDDFEQAVHRDRRFALAYSGLADALNLQGFYSYEPPREVFPIAKEAALRALEIDDTLAEAHASFGFARAFYDWDFEGAQDGLARALELRPDYWTAHHWYGLNLAVLRRPLEAIEHVQRARARAAPSVLVDIQVGGAYYFGRRFDEAIQCCEDAVERAPDFALGHLVLGWAYRQRGQYGDAVAVFERAVSCSEHAPDAIAHLGHAHAVAGALERAHFWLAQLDRMSRERYVSPGHRALVHIGLGAVEPAFDLLEAAFEERYSWLAFLRVDPVFDPLRDDPRFDDLADRIGLAPPRE